MNLRIIMCILAIGYANAARGQTTEGQGSPNLGPSKPIVPRLNASENDRMIDRPVPAFRALPNNTLLNDIKKLPSPSSASSSRAGTSDVEPVMVLIELMVLESPKRWAPSPVDVLMAPLIKPMPSVGPPVGDSKTQSTQAQYVPAIHEQAAILAQDELSHLWDAATRTRHNLQVLTSPKIMTLLNVEASVQVGARMAAIPYLQRTGETTFELKEMPPEQLGLILNVTPKESDQSQLHILLDPLELSLTSMSGRVNFEGIDLQIGKPIISTRSIKTSLTLKQGETGYIEVPTTLKQFAMLVVRCKFISKIGDAAIPQE